MANFRSNSPGEIREIFSREGDDLARAGFSEPDLSTAPEGFLPKPPLWVVDAQDLAEGEQPTLGEGQLLVQRQSLVAEYDKSGNLLAPRNLGTAVVTLRTEGEQ